MYVCICHGITDREINARIAAGAHDVETLRSELGCGSTCGCCLSEVEQMVEAARPARRGFGLPVLQAA